MREIIIMTKNVFRVFPFTMPQLLLRALTAKVSSVTMMGKAATQRVNKNVLIKVPTKYAMKLRIKISRRYQRLHL